MGNLSYNIDKVNLIYVDKFIILFVKKCSQESEKLLTVQKCIIFSIGKVSDSP
jgi:hypothetical protein